MRKCIIFMPVAKADRRERKQVSKPHEADRPAERSRLSLNVWENVIDSYFLYTVVYTFAITYASLGTYTAFNSLLSLHIFKFGMLFDVDMHAYRFTGVDILIRLIIVDTRLLQSVSVFRGVSYSVSSKVTCNLR